MFDLHTHDSFFFRGNGEFSSGENSFTSGVFPPYPQTIYGALRGNWIEQYGSISEFLKGNYEKEIGSPDSHGALRLNGVYLSLDGSLYIPLPQHTQVLKSEDGSMTAYPLELIRGRGCESDGSRYRLVGVSRKKSASPDGKWMKASDWEKLVYKKQPISVLTIMDFIEEQPKTGIYLDADTKTAKDGMLYQYERNMFKENSSLVIEGDLPDSLNVISMGNKGTLWSMEEKPEMSQQLDDLQEEVTLLSLITSSKMVAITLLTPSLVTSELINPQNNNFRFTETEWIQSAITRPVKSGGWDIVRKRPKSRYTMLNPGTTFIVKTPDDSIQEFIDTLKNRRFTDIGIEEGYGKIILSPIKIEEMRG